MIRSLAVTVALLALASGAAAHDYWLVPETFTPKGGAKVAVRMFVGDHFKAEQELAYQPKKTAALKLVTVAGIADVPEAKDGTKPAFDLTAPETGTAVLRHDREWSAITLKADKFTDYLKEEGLEHVIKLRADAGEAQADGKERYRRYLKTILNTGKPDDTATKRLGQLLEIVPAKNPYSLKAGDEFAVTLEFSGKPLAGAKVAALHRDGDVLTTVNATTDKDGRASFKLSKSGTWVVRTVHMRRAVADASAPPADWESFWAAVTFAVP
jgi:uncharacterized GH25 family protein